MRGFVICLGAAKAATTWLSQQVRSHRSVYSVPDKEIHYFISRYGAVNRLSLRKRADRFAEYLDKTAQRFRDPDVVDNFPAELQRFQRRCQWYRMLATGRVDDNWYKSLFSGIPPGFYAADFSPTNARIPVEGVQAMRSLHEHVKIVYILRDPVKRLWSHVRYHAERKGEFDRLQGLSSKQCTQFALEHRLVEDGDYGDVLERFRSVFEEEDLLILDYDQIRSHPGQVVARVFEFLDLPAVTKPQALTKTFNPSVQLEMPSGAFASLYPRMREQLEKAQQYGATFSADWSDGLK